MAFGYILRKRPIVCDHIYIADGWAKDYDNNYHYIKQYCPKCGRLGDPLAEEHSFNTFFRPGESSTCITLGYDIYQCKCSCTQNKAHDSYGSHSYTLLETIPGNCVSAGKERLHCTVCGSETVVDLPGEPSGTHNWQPGQGEAPTCTSSGWTEYYCNICESWKREETRATGHSWTVDIPVGSTNSYIEDHVACYCQNCSAKGETGDLIVTAYTTPDSCEDWGTWDLYDQELSVSFTVPKAPLGHSWAHKDYVDDVPNGNPKEYCERQYCTRCAQLQYLDNHVFKKPDSDASYSVCINCKYPDYEC